MSSSWIYENTSSWLQQLFVYVLKRGYVPKHVAIIMDGNRRFARRNRVDKHQGHVKGFDTLAETLQWCLEMGIQELTVYAFSIENFKRSKDEIDKLMELAKEKFKILIDEWRKLKEHGVCIRAIGNLALLPKDVLCLVLIAMLLTKDNNRAYLNLALSYTSREEMCSVTADTIKGLHGGVIGEADVTNQLTDECFYSYQSTHPEILIRTSGAMRLSDFLTVQCSASYLYVVRVLWPEFSPWNLIMGVFLYQQFRGKLDKLKVEEQFGDLSARGKRYSLELQKNRLKQLLAIGMKEGVLDDVGDFEKGSSEKIYEYYKTHLAGTTSAPNYKINL